MTMIPSPYAKISKTLSYILRHNPGDYGVTMDQEGWVEVLDLLEALYRRGYELDLSTLFDVVKTNDKQRFALNHDNTKIRASQGHTIDLQIAFQEATPPETLYHGTTESNLPSIMRDGLKKMERQHVHLTEDMDAARKVGARRGKPVVIAVMSKSMSENGFRFFLSENHVWLIDHVPPTYLMATGAITGRV
jgi:putative RNA 2'-phosphotransferase